MSEQYAEALGLIRDAAEKRAPFAVLGPKLLEVAPFSSWKECTIAHGHTGGGMEFKGDAALGALHGEQMTPEGLLAHFADLISRNAARFHEVVVVRGISVKNPVRMGQFVLAPLDMLPKESGLDQMIFPAPERGYYLGLGHGEIGPAIPVAILRSEYETSPVAFPLGAFPSDRLQEKRAPLLREAADCIRALTVASISPFAAPIVFHEAVEPGLRDLSRTTMRLYPDGTLRGVADVDLDLAVGLQKEISAFIGQTGCGWRSTCSMRLGCRKTYCSRSWPSEPLLKLRFSATPTPSCRSA